MGSLSEAFARDGSVTIRGVVAAAECAAMHELFASIMPEAAFPPAPGVVHELTGVARALEPLMAIARDPRFGALVADALGATRVQLLQDSLLYKPASAGGAVELHQDRTYIGYLVPAQVATIRIALVPEDEANGCMHVVDGSHHWGTLGGDRSLSATSVEAATLTAEQQGRAARPLPLAAGDVTIHHCLTLHGSAPNTSARPRRTIILRMFDAACTLDRARLPPGAEAYFPTDAEGRLSTSAFPLVHTG
jgi:ectoine hydroxylase-related dioxygenase (phytanoyl-CoA dioxygenase family)